MQVQEARDAVLARWQSIADGAFKCPMRVEDDLTVEYDWGWSFTLVPVDPARCDFSKHRYGKARFAIDRETGHSYPIGSKGIAEARAYLMKWRRKRAEAAENPPTDAEKTDADEPV